MDKKSYLNAANVFKNIPSRTASDSIEIIMVQSDGFAHFFIDNF